MAAAAARGSQEINIDEAIGKTYRVLRSGTPYAVALYLNIQQFSSSIDTRQELQTCQDEIKEVKAQMSELREEIRKIKDTSGDYPPIALGLENAAPTGTDDQAT